MAQRGSAQYGSVRPVSTGRHAAGSPGAFSRSASSRPRAGRGGYGGYANGGHGKNGSEFGNRRGNPQKGGVWRVVFWAALVVFVVAVVALGAIAFSYWKGQHAYDSLAEQAFDAPVDAQGVSLADLTVDWDALRAVNPDVIAWIYIPGTIVNYPVMYSGDDQTYLTYDFYGNEGGWWMADYGAVFLSGMNDPSFSDANNLIYGHNLLNGSMFADVAKLADNDQFNSHRTVYLLTPQGNYRLTSFAMVNVFASDPLAQASFATSQDYTAYVQDKIDRSIVSPEEGMPDASSLSQTFALSTCDHDHAGNKRYVLFCFVEEYVAHAAESGNAGTESTDESAGSGVAEGNASMVDPSIAEEVGESSGEMV